jgi:hypothetical protein
MSSFGALACTPLCKENIICKALENNAIFSKTASLVYKSVIE